MVEERNLKGKVLAIASGKGGTGKTTLAVNLANVMKDELMLIDCDVEEPNCHIFLQSKCSELKSEEFYIPKPVFDLARCTGCGLCERFCRYNAIVIINRKPKLLNDLCHSCGGCVMVCPRSAIREEEFEVGVIWEGSWSGNGEGKRFVYGELKITEARSEPLIEYIKTRFVKEANNFVIIDAPPGTSCPAVASVKGVDFVLLVTEPTPFGLNDLKLAVEMCKVLGLKFGVVINRSDIGYPNTREYCKEENIPIIAEIPFSEEIARVYSAGKIVSDEIPEFRKICENILSRVNSML